MTKRSLLTVMGTSKLLAILAMMSMMFWSAGTANAASGMKDSDRDHLSNKV